jgi:GTP cyclohydrolase I
MNSTMTATSSRSGMIDLDVAETAAADLMRTMGMDPCESNLVATPRRVAKAYADCSPNAHRSRNG